MKSFINEMKSKFKEIEEELDAVGHEDADIDNDGDTDASDEYLHAKRKAIKKAIDSEDSVEEISSSGGAGAYMSKNWVGKPKKKIKYPGVAEALEEKYEQLVESYREYAKGPNVTPSKKVNETIKEIATKLQEIETLVKNAARLKTEAGVTQEHYWKTTGKNLNRIGERLLKISERVRALGE